MLLTPIHIPGKLKRDQTKASVAARKALVRNVLHENHVPG